MGREKPAKSIFTRLLRSVWWGMKIKTVSLIYSLCIFKIKRVTEKSTSFTLMGSTQWTETINLFSPSEK